MLKYQRTLGIASRQCLNMKIEEIVSWRWEVEEEEEEEVVVVVVGGERERTSSILVHEGIWSWS